MTTPAAELVALAGDERPALVAPPARIRSRRRPWGLWLSGAAVAGWLLLVVLGPWLVRDPDAGNLGQRLAGPGSPGHLLGTDSQGRDLLARLVNGARPSILAGLIPVVLAGVVGTFLGVTAGQAGRRGRAVIMRTLDVFFAFPTVLLAIGIAATLGGGLFNLVIALTVVLVPAVARVAEVETVRLRELDFLESARASGARPLVISLLQVLPNVGPALLAYCTALVGVAVVYAGGLSYLGLGVPPPAAEWGRTIYELQGLVFTKPALAIAPALVVVAVSISFNTFGNALGHRLDVRQVVAR